MARLLVEAHGGKFVAALQPVSYFSRNPSAEQRARDADMRRQFDAVYPLIKAKLSRVGAEDLVGALDTPEPLYNDDVHLNPAGNAIIARRISGLVDRALGKPAR